jgi:hypothetical protein
MLKELWQRWVKVAKIIGDFQARPMLSLFYLLLISILSGKPDPFGAPNY